MSIIYLHKTYSMYYVYIKAIGPYSVIRLLIMHLFITTLRMAIFNVFNRR